MYSRFKHWVARVNNIHRPDGRPNVFIFAAPRGGSTWLMELILTQPGFKPANEPFNLRTSTVGRELATRGLREWTDLYKAANDSAITDYIRDIASGSTGVMNPFFYRNHFRLVTHRVCFKILHGGEDRINRFRDACNGRVVLLLRHPIAVSLSRKSLPRLEAFLEGDYRRHFSDGELQLAREILYTGTRLEKAVVDWCLQTAVPMRTAEPDWLILTYEQLVLEPEPLIQIMADKLALPRPERMMKRLPTPSSSTHHSDEHTKRVLSEADSETPRSWLVEKWRGQVTPAEEEQVMAILDGFELDLYTAGSFLPADHLWLSRA